MSYRQRIVLILVATLAGCASPSARPWSTQNEASLLARRGALDVDPPLGQRVTRQNSKVTMPHYTVRIPPDIGWQVQTEGGPSETTTASMDLGVSLLQMKFIRIVIANEQLGAMTAKEVADDFRKIEWNIMIEQGVKKGQYELKDITMTEEVLGGRTLYVMKYKATSTRNWQDAQLYLLFPKESHNDWFLAIHCSFTGSIGTHMSEDIKSQFLGMIQGVELLLKPFVQGEVDAIGKFEWDQRLQICNHINQVASRLLIIGMSSPMKTGNSKLLKDSRIALYDNDFDGNIDTYACLRAGETNTMDFGFIFDLNHDGHMDYLVFNGGSFPTKDMKFGWMNYHVIDSNYDGKMDIMIYSVVLEGGGLDEDVRAWLYDTDFDGIIDKAEYLGPGVEMPIPETEGGFLIRLPGGEKRLLKKDLQEGLAFWSSLLSEINALLAQGK